MASEHVIEINDDNFQSAVLEAELPSLLDFWGPMCGPCKAMEPMIDRLAADYQGRLQVGKVNVNECPQTALRFAIQSLPTLVLIKGGEVRDQFSGRPSPAALDKFIQQVL